MPQIQLAVGLEEQCSFRTVSKLGSGKFGENVPERKRAADLFAKATTTVTLHYSSGELLS